MMRASHHAVFAAATLALAMGCGTDTTDASGSCVPGESRACTGPAGCTGGQVCNAEGTAFLACDCGGGGTGGQAGSAGSAGATSGCPTGLPGPELVEIPEPAGGSYCMDATEVTQGHYDAFLAANPDPTDTSLQDGPCAGRPLVQAAACLNDPAHPISLASEWPVVCVSWCQAGAYCKWAGKRLCGKLGGGESKIEWNGTNFIYPTDTEWVHACNAGGTQRFPWGTGPAPTCTKDRTPVTASPDCEGAYPGLFGMLTNVREWEATCSFPESNGCVLRGAYGCDGHDIFHFVEGHYSGGFRCCHDGTPAGG